MTFGIEGLSGYTVSSYSINFKGSTTLVKSSGATISGGTVVISLTNAELQALGSNDVLCWINFTMSTNAKLVTEKFKMAVITNSDSTYTSMFTLIKDRSYESLQTEELYGISMDIDSSGGSGGATSHVGMVVMSTALSTMESVIAIYGGVTWVKIEGKFLLGADSNHAVNSTGGEETHTLTVDEMPSHVHELHVDYAYDDNNHSGTLIQTGDTAGNYYTTSGGIGNWGIMSGNALIDYTGGGQAHNNMPPYKAVYIWERTA